MWFDKLTINLLFLRQFLQFFYVASNESFFFSSTPSVELLLSHSSFMFVFVFFSVDKLNRLMSLRKLGSSV